MMSIERTYRLPLRVVRMRGKAGRTALDMALLIISFREYCKPLTGSRQDANPAIFCRFGLFVVESGYRLLERKAAHCVFADAAEVKRAVALDDVCDFGEAVAGAVLEVFDDVALWI